MYIFTFNGYSGGREESRRLLARAMEAYQEIADLRPRRSSEELVASLEYTEKGKPFVPGWHHFSISHSENTWTVLFDEKECGIDVQYEKDVDMDKVAGRVFAPEDAEAAKASKETFFQLWARREAALKAAGLSVFDRIPSVQSMEVAIDVETWQVFDAELLGTEDGCHAAVCTDHIPLEIHYYGL